MTFKKYNRFSFFLGTMILVQAPVALASPYGERQQPVMTCAPIANEVNYPRLAFFLITEANQEENLSLTLTKGPESAPIPLDLRGDDAHFGARLYRRIKQWNNGRDVEYNGLLGDTPDNSMGIILNLSFVTYGGNRFMVFANFAGAGYNSLTSLQCN